MYRCSRRSADDRELAESGQGDPRKSGLKLEYTSTAGIFILNLPYYKSTVLLTVQLNLNTVTGPGNIFTDCNMYARGQGFR